MGAGQLHHGPLRGDQEADKCGFSSLRRSRPGTNHLIANDWVDRLRARGGDAAVEAHLAESAAVDHSNTPPLGAAPSRKQLERRRAEPQLAEA